MLNPAAPFWIIKRSCIHAVNAIMMMLICTHSSVFAADATLSWNPNVESDLAGYRVYYGTVSGVYTQVITVWQTATPSAQQHTVSDLEAGTTYYFAVTSFDSHSNESGFSNEASKTFPPDATTPDATGSDATAPMDITDFKAVPGDRQVGLSWTNPADPNYIGVRIRVRTDGTFPIDENDGVLVGDFPGLSQENESHTHTDLSFGSTYYYSAFSYDAGGHFSHTVHASATPLPGGATADPPDQSLTSQSLSGGCGMVFPGNGKPPGPGQAADMMALLGGILFFLLIHTARKHNMKESGVGFHHTTSRGTLK